MQRPIDDSIPCPKCHRLIEQKKQQVHQIMCSTSHLRRSRLTSSSTYPSSLPNQPPSHPNPNNPPSPNPKKHPPSPSPSQIIQPKPKPKPELKPQQTVQKCRWCLQQFELGEIVHHEERECRHRLVPCINCEIMFPLSLWNQHSVVCQANMKMQLGGKQEEQQQKQEEDSNSDSGEWVGTLITGIGASLFSFGVSAASYCQNVVQKSKGPALLYLESVRSNIQDTLQDLFTSLAYQQNIEGMPRDQIRQLPIKNFPKPSPPQSPSPSHQQQICTICFCQLQDQQVIKQLLCKHIFHPTCIDKWLKINRTCPLCKRDQVLMMMDQLKEKEQEEEREREREREGDGN